MTFLPLFQCICKPRTGWFRGFAILFFLLFLNTGSGRARAMAEVGQASMPVPLWKHMEFFHDGAASLSFDEIRVQVFRPLKTVFPSFHDGNYWLRLQLRLPPEMPDEELLITLHYTFPDEVQFFYQDQHGAWQSSLQGDRYPFSQRELQVRFFNWTLPPTDKEVRTYYFRIRSAEAMYLPFWLDLKSEFLQKDHDNQLLAGAFFGVMCILTLYYTLIAFTTNTPASFCYVLFIISTLFLTASLNGYTFEYLWPDYPVLRAHGFYMSCFAMTITSLNLFRQAFRTVEGEATLHRYSGYGMIVLFLIMNSAFFLSTRYLLILTGVGTFLSGSLCVAILWKSRRRYPSETLIFSFAFVPLMILYACFSYFVIAGFTWAEGAVLNLYTALTWGHLFNVGVIGLGLALAMREMQQEQLRIQIRAMDDQKAMTSSFARFVPGEFPELLEKADYQQLQRGDAVARNLTILFSDLRDFTTISETMNPRQTFDLINEYLNHLEPEVSSRGGFIDKYIGDAIMAIFPNSPGQAVNAAAGMLNALVSVNRLRRQRGEPPLRSGIGIHTGRVMLGIVGSHRRIEGTVISDAVNTSSRLESLTRDLGCDLLISRQVLESIPEPERPHHRGLGSFHLKGRVGRLEVVEILHGRESRDLQAFAATAADFREGTEYLLTEPARAAAAFRRVLDRHPEDRVAARLLQSCEDPLGRPA